MILPNFTVFHVLAIRQLFARVLVDSRGNVRVGRARVILHDV
jgi:hypothetical protein